jgi:hypothetical protein
VCLYDCKKGQREKGVHPEFRARVISKLVNNSLEYEVDRGKHSLSEM